MITAAYVFMDRFDGLRQGDADRLTHVNFSFALIRDGKGSVDHWSNGDIVRKFIRDKGHIKAVLSVGGWGAGGFSPAVSTPEGRELLAQSLVDIVNDYGFDGIDMDWEYPCDDIAGIEASPDDKPNFTLLIQLLRDKLGGGKIISMAAGGMQRCVDNLEISRLVELMDFINVMTYDMCPWNYVSHHTSLHASDITRNPNCHTAIGLYEAAGVPRSKLVIGAAFYARLYQDVDGLDAPAANGPTFFGGSSYASILEKVEEAGGGQYDEKAEAPYIYNARERSFLTFDNPRSLKAKVAYVKSTGLAGIMFWEYNGDTMDSTLLKAIAE